MLLALCSFCFSLRTILQSIKNFKKSKTVFTREPSSTDIIEVARGPVLGKNCLTNHSWNNQPKELITTRSNKRGKTMDSSQPSPTQSTRSIFLFIIYCSILLLFRRLLRTHLPKKKNTTWRYSVSTASEPSCSTVWECYFVLVSSAHNRMSAATIGCLTLPFWDNLAHRH